METRKVQVTGNSTYVVSLPKMWIMETGIKKGDGLRLHLHSDGAILLTLASNENDLTDIKESDIEIEDSLDNVARRFIGLYLAGYDIIHFKFRTGLNAKGKNKIKKIFRMVSGFEVVDENIDTITVQDLLDQSMFPPEKVIRRMYLITRMMLSDAVAAFEKNNSSVADDVEARDDEVDRLYWMIAKQYNLILWDVSFSEKMKISSNKGLSYLLIAKSLERMADHAKKIAINIRLHSEENKILTAEIKNISKKLIDLVNTSIAAFFFWSF